MEKQHQAENDFGFVRRKTDPWSRIGQADAEAYEDTIVILPFPIGIEKIASGAAIHLAHSANKLREKLGWSESDTRYILSLTIMKGKAGQ